MTGAYLPPVQTDCVIDLYHGDEIPTPLDAFRQAAASGVALVIHKATQGVDMVDETYAARKVAAKSAGALWGAYHFCDGSDPVAQAKHFLSVVGNPTDFVLMVDAEKNDESQVTIPRVIALVRAIVQQVGRKLDILYMGRSGPDGNGTGMTLAAMAELASLVTALMLPEYGNTPICPLGFSTWLFHQYTGDGINGSGYVAGIGSKLDRSYFAGTVDELKAWHAAMCAGIPPSQVIVVQPPAPTKPSLPPVMSGDVPTARDRMVACVKALQTELAAQGYQPGPIDGDAGPRTIAALQAWR
jgi:lysozyme